MHLFFLLSFVSTPKQFSVECLGGRTFRSQIRLIWLASQPEQESAPKQEGWMDTGLTAQWPVTHPSQDAQF